MVIILLPYPMIVALHLRFQSPSPHPSLLTSLPHYFFTVVGAQLLCALFSSLRQAPAATRYGCLCICAVCVKSFRIRTSKNPPVTPLQSALPKTQHLNPFRIRTYKKNRGGRGPITVTHSPRVSANSASPRCHFSFLLTTHNSPPISSHLCLCLLFLLSSPPQGENAHVRK